MAWEGCLNVRDLGGQPTLDGRETRWRAVVRSDDPASLSPAGVDALVAYGVRTVVDLRLPSELEVFPSPFARPDTPDVRYVHRSLIDPDASPLVDAGTFPLAEEYIDLLERYGSQIAAVMRAIAEAPDGVVLVHCAAGKDRTGIVSALLLEVAGVPRQEIAADYALTAECLRPEIEDWLRDGPGERAARERELARTEPRPEIMLEVLQHLDQRHGGAEGYLRSAGLTHAEIAELGRRLAPHSAG